MRNDVTRSNGSTATGRTSARPKTVAEGLSPSAVRAEDAESDGSRLYSFQAAGQLDADSQSVREGGITCTRAEFAKLRWLNGIIAGCSPLHRAFRDERAGHLWDSGTDVEYDLDWRSVAQRCLPDVVLVLFRDPSRVRFDTFPKYVIVPSSSACLDVQLADWLEGVTPTVRRQDDEVSSALKVLAEAASNSTPEKRDNAISAVARVKRLLQ